MVDATIRESSQPGMWTVEVNVNGKNEAVRFPSDEAASTAYNDFRLAENQKEIKELLDINRRLYSEHQPVSQHPPAAPQAGQPQDSVIVRKSNSNPGKWEVEVTIPSQYKTSRKLTLDNEQDAKKVKNSLESIVDSAYRAAVFDNISAGVKLNEVKQQQKQQLNNPNPVDRKGRRIAGFGDLNRQEQNASNKSSNEAIPQKFNTDSQNKQPTWKEVRKPSSKGILNSFNSLKSSAKEARKSVAKKFNKAIGSHRDKPRSPRRP